MELSEDRFYEALYRWPAAVRRLIPRAGFEKLRPAQISALAATSSRPSSSVSELARLLACRHASVSVLIKELRELGLVERVASADRRQRRFRVTATGRAFLRRLYLAERSHPS